MDAGLSIHRIQRPKLLHGSLHHLLDLLQVRDVCNGDAGLATHGLYLLGHLFRAGAVGLDIVDADIVAVRGQS